MNSAKRFLMVSGAFALATLVFTLVNPKAVHAFAATLVQVVNTSQNPVPIAGTVAVDPNNNSVQVTNTPTVTVNSLPAVQVSNQPADHALQAVVLTGIITIDDTSLGNSVNLKSGFSDFTVPAGKRFVVQFVTFRAQLPPGEKLYLLGLATFSVESGGNFSSLHYLVPSLTGTAFGSDFYAVSQPITAYSDAGFIPAIFADRDNSTGRASINATVSGYLVDCPNGSCPMQP